MKKIRTFLAALTAVTMCVGAVPVAQVHLPQVSVVASAEDLTYDNLTYEIVGKETKTVTITGCDQNATTIEVPAEIEGMPVTKIGNRAFQDCPNLSKVTISDSVIDFGENVFTRDTSLRTVKLPVNLKEMGTGTFSGCTSLTKMTLPKTLPTVPQDTFSGCKNLNTVSVPEGIVSLGRNVLLWNAPIWNLLRFPVV